MKKFDNGLKDIDIEMLALLSEECGEIIQAVGKILRHGYNSYNPLLPSEKRISNKGQLEKEIAHLDVAVLMLQNHKRIDRREIQSEMNTKRVTINNWLHHARSE